MWNFIEINNEQWLSHCGGTSVTTIYDANNKEVVTRCQTCKATAPRSMVVLYLMMNGSVREWITVKSNVIQ